MAAVIAACGLYCLVDTVAEPISLNIDTLSTYTMSCAAATVRTICAEGLFTSYLQPHLVVAIQFVLGTLRGVHPTEDGNEPTGHVETNAGVTVVASTITVLLRSISHKPDPLTSAATPYIGRLQLAVLSVVLNRVPILGLPLAVLVAMQPIVQGIGGGVRTLYLSAWVGLLLVSSAAEEVKERYHNVKESKTEE
ncbi:hypothetical protein KIPB_007602 [Kipferlia bialata]|uniref:Uncharacterized protein n=1 Tax=Kipferlia bialata TaxID=797122 RepID=A0A9K3CZ13_9EUKA|nr:hypothetical protein KIPB_007602 [Kipferlia bialata]|eukprot:g7602.t1